ncbi:uncharacterized [Tachysurus ichikawai]
MVTDLRWLVVFSLRPTKEHKGRAITRQADEEKAVRKQRKAELWISSRQEKRWIIKQWRSAFCREKTHSARLSSMTAWEPCCCCPLNPLASLFSSQTALSFL